MTTNHDGGGIAGASEAEQDEPVLWEVLEHPCSEPVRVEPYLRPHRNNPEPVTIVLKESMWVPGATPWLFVIGASMWALAFLGLGPWILFDYGWFPGPPKWLEEAAAGLGILGGCLMASGSIRHRRSRPSVVRITGEGLSVTTPSGSLDGIAWEDVSILRMYRSTTGNPRHERSLHLRWQHVTTGESVDLALGNVHHARRLDRVLRVHAPKGYENLR